jgi:hypothetical protein
VFLVTRLDKPLLHRGPAGVGKTELAKTLAAVTGPPLLRLQCYEGQDETKALYEWDYGKQLLYTQILREKIGEVVADAPDPRGRRRAGSARRRACSSPSGSSPAARCWRRSAATSRRCCSSTRSTAPTRRWRPCCWRRSPSSRSRCPRSARSRTTTPPYVILTSNNTRDLSAALKRRCLHLFLDYPTAERELEIVRSKRTGLPDALARQLVDIVRGLRELELRKSPSISETIDWARTLAVLGVQELTATILSDTASVVVKYDKDVRRTIGALPRLVDPNATVPEHGHGHGHGHGHDDHPHPPGPGGGAGRRGRARGGRRPRGAGGQGHPGPVRAHLRLQPPGRGRRRGAPQAAEGAGRARVPQLRRGPGPQAGAVSAAPPPVRKAL